MRRLLLVLVLALALPAVAQARPNAVTWCGADAVTQNRVPDLELSSSRQVRLVYAIPSDVSDNFVATAPGIATDAAWIDEWWRAQDPARTPRFDRYPFPGCTSKFGSVDIGFVRLPGPSSRYTAVDSPSLLLDRDLQSLFGAAQKTIVYYDGPIANNRVCGETDYLSSNTGGDRGIVYVYIRSGCRLFPAGSGSSAQVAAHELLHNLGAVPGPAPNECPNSPAHVCDGSHDILYPFLGSGSTLDVVTLDFNRNDYYGHSGSWFDVQDSGWLSHLPQFPFSLAVAGEGTVRATANGNELPCDRGCTDLALDNDTQLAVSATAAPGWRFAGCSGTCTLTVGGPTSLTVTFARITTLVLEVTVKGKGRVTSTPAGIACTAATCRAAVTASTVKLTAKPAAGWAFNGWSGACRGTGTCTVRADAAVAASFARR